MCGVVFGFLYEAIVLPVHEDRTHCCLFSSFCPFCFLSFTSMVSFTGVYTEDKPKVTSVKFRLSPVPPLPNLKRKSPENEVAETHKWVETPNLCL